MGPFKNYIFLKRTTCVHVMKVEVNLKHSIPGIHRYHDQPRQFIWCEPTVSDSSATI